jgi:hypothetical protein
MRALIALLFSAAPAFAQEVEVDVALVLAVDMSGSMDREEKAVQRRGYVDAIAGPEVWAAIRRGPYQRIALSYLEWAGAHAQVVVMGWRLIDSPAAAEAFAAELAGRPFSAIRGTSISGGIDAARELLRDSPFAALRKVIDVSGDGANRLGRPVTEARDAALREGIAINGLPIVIRPNRAEGDLARYYADCVAGGAGSFTLPVHAAHEFADAVRRKLVLDIAGAEPKILPAQATEPTDCLIGERLRSFYEDR